MSATGIWRSTRRKMMHLTHATSRRSSTSASWLSSSALFVLENHDEDEGDNPDDDEAEWSPFGTAAPPGAPPACRVPSWRGERDGTGAERRRAASTTGRASISVFG